MLITRENKVYKSWFNYYHWERRKYLFFPDKYICVFKDKILQDYKSFFLVRYISDGDVIYRSIENVWGPFWREFSPPLYGEDEFGVKWENCSFLRVGRW